MGEQFRGMRAGGDGVALKIDAQLRISDRIFQLSNFAFSVCVVADVSLDVATIDWVE